MIERYTHPEMGHIWTLENEFRTMLQEKFWPARR